MELTIENVASVITEQINPFLEIHSGSCEVLEINQEAKMISIRLHGGCAGCPSSSITLYHGILPILEEAFPGVQIELV